MKGRSTQLQSQWTLRMKRASKKRILAFMNVIYYTSLSIITYKRKHSIIYLLNYYQNYSMQNIVNFGGLSLTQIFQIQPIQSLLIKFWYLGLTSELIIHKEDQMALKIIKKTITFANCFTFEMPIKSYVNFIDRIMLAISQLDPKKTFTVLLGHLKENKITNVTFQLFGVAFLQLFGRLLEIMDSQILVKVLRKIYLEITMISKTGSAILKPDTKNIKEINFEEFIPNLQELLSQRTLTTSKLINPEHHSLAYEGKEEPSHRDLRTIKGRLQSQRNFNSSFREGESGQYPIGDKMRQKQKANLSCFMMGGFQIVDYSDSINQLHKKLLTKILLNK